MRKLERFPFIRTRLVGSLWVLSVLGGVVSVMACTVPVFRFALDRWEADPYRLTIPAAWATRPDVLKLLVPLRGNGEANITVVESDDPSLDQASLHFPHHDKAIWEGSLVRETLDSLLMSKGREELLKRLLAGDSVVWMVFTTEEDKGEVGRISGRLSFLEQVASLPLQNPDDPDSQLGPGPALRLAFSVVSISLDDPAESVFARMVAGPDQSHFVENGISFAAPVFGRGRVLGAWPVAELDDTMIEDASLFLVGRCSCRVKNENPGWDVVMKVDWERELRAVEEAETGAHSAEPAENSTVTLETKVVTPENLETESPEVKGLGIPAVGIAGAVIVLCLIGGFVLWFKR